MSAASDLPALIDRIEAELYEQFPPADPAAIDAVAGGFRDLFGIDVPPAYRTLWQRSDGVDADGLVIFATTDADLDGPQQRLGVLQSNQRLIAGLTPISTTMRFVGQRFDQLLAFDTADGKWKLVDSTAWDIDDEDDVFDSFEDLVGPLLLETVA